MNFVFLLELFVCYTLVAVSCSSPHSQNEAKKDETEKIGPPPLPPNPPSRSGAFKKIRIVRSDAANLDKWVLELVDPTQITSRFDTFFEKVAKRDAVLKVCDYNSKFSEIIWAFASEFMSTNTSSIMCMFSELFDIIHQARIIRYLLPEDFIKSINKHQEVLQVIKGVIASYNSFVKALYNFKQQRQQLNLAYDGPVSYKKVMKFTKNKLDRCSLTFLLEFLKSSQKFLQELCKAVSCNHDLETCQKRNMLLTAIYRRIHSDIVLCEKSTALSPLKGLFSRKWVADRLPSIGTQKPPKLPPFDANKLLDRATRPYLPQGVPDAKKFQFEIVSATKELIVKDAKLQIPENTKYNLIDFKIERELGRSDQAIIYKGTYTPTRKPVALKVYSSKDWKQARLECAKEVLYMNLLKEAPFICQALYWKKLSTDEAKSLSGRYVLVMEFAQNGDLYHQLTYKKWTDILLRKWMSQIVVAVQHMHARGIIHRDLKLENILITSSEDIQVCDFAISKRFKLHHGKQSDINGTLVHVPGEIYEGKHASYESDIFALGMILYHFITPDDNIINGLFDKTADLADQSELKLLAALSKYYVKLPVRDNAPAGAEELFRGMVHPDPQKRFTLVQIMQSEYFRTVDWRKLDALEAPLSSLNLEISKNSN